MKAIKRLSKSPPSPVRSNKPCALFLLLSLPVPFALPLSPFFPSVETPHSYHRGTVNPPSLLLLPSGRPSGGTREAKRSEHICHLPATHNTEQAINFGLTCICSSLGHTHTIPPTTAGKLKGEGGGRREVGGRWRGEPKLTLDIQYGQVLNWPGPS